jgi:hypothetical protein
MNLCKKHKQLYEFVCMNLYKNHTVYEFILYNLYTICTVLFVLYEFVLYIFCISLLVRDNIAALSPAH